MKYQDLVDWAKGQGKTEEDIKRYVLWEYAMYLANLSVYELRNELVEGSGKIEVMSTKDWADYFDVSDDEYQEGMKTSLTGFWNEFK